jgi:hypothetical protein
MEYMQIGQREGVVLCPSSIPNEPPHQLARALAPSGRIGYLLTYMRQAQRSRAFRVSGVWLFLTVLAAGCTQRLAAPTATPSGDQAPVSLRNFEVVTADGHRAVLLRLSRLPTKVGHSSVDDPPQIVVQAWGPVGDGDLPERNLPQIDPQIRALRVSRHDGWLTIVLDMHGARLPPHSVHQMADWIMIRLEQGQG